MNGRLSAQGMGSRSVSVSQINYGVGFILNGEAVVKDGRALYTKQVSGDSFSIVVNFATYDQFVRTMEWLLAYARKVTDPDHGYTPMRIHVPSVKFDRPAVIKSGIRFGDKVGDLVRTATLAFEGTPSLSDPRTRQISTYVLPRTFTQEARFASPGNRRMGGGTLEETLYEGTPWQGGSVLDMWQPI